MALDRILLGLLRSPAAGYDLKQQVDVAFSHFWSADLPQIYRTLNRMERAGLLSVAIEPSDQGPDRRVYRLTPAGTSELEGWLQGEPALDIKRIGSLARVCFLGALEDDGAAADRLYALRKQLEERLAGLQAMAKHWEANDPGYPDCDNADEFYLQLTLDARIHELMAQVAWASRSIRRVEDRVRKQALRQNKEQ